MKRFHIALSTDRIEETIADYTERLGAAPAVVVDGEYALWRTDTLNVSIRQGPDNAPGALRHLGWEDPAAEGFTAENRCERHSVGAFPVRGSRRGD